MHMKSFVRNIILSLSAFVVFLSPLSIQVDPGLLIQKSVTPETTQSVTEHSIISFDLNMAHAQGKQPDKCSFGDVGCYTVNLMELIFVNTTQFFAGIAGFILDFFLQFSISSESYRDSGFIEAGWEIIRDFTNIIFIFALLLIAFKMVLGQGDSGAKKTLVKTILIALTINFSLFFVYAIIDSSNLLAYTFYTKIEAPEVSFGVRGSEQIATNTGDDGGTTFQFGGVSGDTRKAPSISLALLEKVNPQKLLTELKGTKDTERLILIFIVAAINIAFIMLFLSVSLLFLSRTLGLMILAILAPFALATLTLGPKAAGLSYVGWNKWFPQLLSLAFMAPVFLFFLYLTTLFSKITDSMVINDAAGIIATVFQVALPMLTIFTLVKLSQKVATKMAGELGGTINGYVQKAAGAGLGIAALVATGGVAAGAGALGGVAGAVGKNKYGRMLGANKAASGLRSFSKTAASTKFDISKIPGFNQFAGKDGSKIMSSISGKSLREQYQDKQKDFKEKGVFSNDTGKLDKKYEDRKLKEAKDSANGARKKAEAKHEAELYQAQMGAANTKNDKDYVDATKNVANAVVKLAEIAQENKSYKEVLKDSGATVAEKKIAQDNLDANKVNKKTFETAKSIQQSAMERTDGYKAQEHVKKVQAEKTKVGDGAETKSRQASAAQISNDPALANKILGKIDPKDQTKKKVEDLIDLLEEK
ncbi:MAG: hypothetical protein ACJAV6_000582 [Candidatus Paceibacteria bacterium]|jgi:hypothetical protein